jgi:hypothetical protein
MLSTIVRIGSTLCICNEAALVTPPRRHWYSTSPDALRTVSAVSVASSVNGCSRCSSAMPSGSRMALAADSAT